MSNRKNMKYSMKHKPFVIVVSGPSGTGKTTVLNYLKTLDNSLFCSVSATSRKKRSGEENGRDYIFVSREDFKRWIEQEKLLEWAEVYGEYYGTPRKPVMDALSRGMDVIMDLEVQGKRSLEREFKDDLVSIFLLPPDLDELKKRLISRGAEDEEKLKLRLALAESELRWAYEYEYWVINDNVKKAANRILSIIDAERMRQKRVIYKDLKK